MWEIINQYIIAAELILALVGAVFVWGKKNALKTVIFMCFVFILNFTLHTVPVLYGKIVLGDSTNFLFYLFDIIPATLKSLVGDASTGMIEGYTTIFPQYIYIYCVGLLIGFMSTSFAVISTFGRRILNVFKIAYIMNDESCDIIIGNSAEALSFAKTYKRCIIALPSSEDKTVANSLINSGYKVLRRDITKEFLTSRFFNSKTKYNIISLNDSNNHYDDINSFVACLDDICKLPQIHFFVETDENAVVTEKKHIDAIGKEHRQRITLFSRNELLARTFVEENPIIRDMPGEFFDEDSSVKEGVALNVFVLGFSRLSREIYKQFIINNQLCKYSDGTYKAFPISYYIYDKKVNENIWEIDGLADTIRALSEKDEEYFTLPEMPYITECIKNDCHEFDAIKEVVKKVEAKNSFSYILVDAGDVYKNIEIAERFNLLLNKCENFRVFIYNSSELSVYGNVTCYGNTKELFTHDVIVNESLTDLAKSINTFYCGTDNWSELSYFDMYSNISLAGNLRFKLNLLGLDYIKDKNSSGDLLLEKALSGFEDDSLSYEDYFKKSTKNALLAQEHLRWNAYHLLSGYLPMKKVRITVEKEEQNGKIKKTIKNNLLKKHACITTFKGLDELSKYLADKANEVSGNSSYQAKDFDYYKFDDLLLRAMPGFFKENDYSVVEK